MASLNRRKQLVNELRKAHFPFGFESNRKFMQITNKQSLNMLKNIKNMN